MYKFVAGKILFSHKKHNNYTENNSPHIFTIIVKFFNNGNVSNVF